MIIAVTDLKNDVNLGVLARTCEALGADLVIPEHLRSRAMKSNTCKYQPLTVRDMKRWLFDAIVARRVIGIETGGKPIGCFDPDPNVVLLLGHETLGIEPFIKKKLREIATLPMRGRSPCLNVGAAGSVAAYHFSGLLTTNGHI